MWGTSGGNSMWDIRKKEGVFDERKGMSKRVKSHGESSDGE